MTVAVKKSTTKNTNANRGESAIDLQEQIRRRVYELYERRGREYGHEVEDWLQAEAEVARENHTARLRGGQKNSYTDGHQQRQKKSQQVKQVEMIGAASIGG